MAGRGHTHGISERDAAKKKNPDTAMYGIAGWCRPRCGDDDGIALDADVAHMIEAIAGADRARRSVAGDRDIGLQIGTCVHESGAFQFTRRLR